MGKSGKKVVDELKFGRAPLTSLNQTIREIIYLKLTGSETASYGIDQYYSARSITMLISFNSFSATVVSLLLILIKNSEF